MGEVKTKKPPVTYVVKKGQPIQKFVGYTKERDYVADDSLGVCDCVGFTNHGKCKHMEFRTLLTEFNVDELVFFGDHLGDCIPKSQEQITKYVMEDLWETLSTHLKITDLDIKRFIPNQVDPNVFNCVELSGKRSKPTLIVGYTHGVLVFLKPEVV